MEKFFSCDWGTSHFRLRLIDTVSMSVLSMRESNQGIADSFALFNQSRWDEKERRSFYLSSIQRHISSMAQELGGSLEDIPVVISGMASSSIGITELPYKQVPFSCSGDDLLIYAIPPGQQFKHKVLIISGATTGSDVMRGEETQLIGGFKDNAGEQLYIFPGTHSKHVIVKDGVVVNFKTYMTGEFFALLSSKSILASSVNEGKGINDTLNQRWFRKGVIDATDGNLLHNAFLVRTNELFKKCSNEQNYYYLSGLLVGTELKDLDSTADQVILVCNDNLAPYYMVAWDTLDLLSPLKFQIDDMALVKGQLRLLKRGDALELPA